MSMTRPVDSTSTGRLCTPEKREELWLCEHPASPHPAPGLAHSSERLRRTIPAVLPSFTDISTPAALLPALTNVLQTILSRNPGVCDRRCTRDRAVAVAVAEIAPAVVALTALRHHLHSDPALQGALPWDGLIHRRLTLTHHPTPRSPHDLPPLTVPSTVMGATPSDDSSITCSLTALRLTQRGPWNLATVTQQIDNATITSSFTALREPMSHGSVMSGSPQRCEHNDAEHDRQCAILTAADVAAWAEATGDTNALHLRPGAARAAGLIPYRQGHPGPGVNAETGDGDTPGDDGVVAHGTLLAALHRALTSLSTLASVEAGTVPAEAGGDWRFLSPLYVGEAVEVAADDTTLYGPPGVLLRWRRA